MLIEFPNKKEWKKLSGDFEFQILNLKHENIQIQHRNIIEEFSQTLAIQSWCFMLNSRVYFLNDSYKMMSYYFKKGIPDDEWFLSPGRNGESIEYLPHFKDERQHLIRLHFYYFAEIFYYYAFTIFDTIGHIIKEMFRLEIRRNVNFVEAVKRLKPIDSILYDSLKSILESSVYRKAKQIRNNGTHNFAPGYCGPAYSRDELTTFSYGENDYIPSRQIMENALELLHLLDKTNTFIKQ